MYSFIDVNEQQGGASLPAEALQINGEYIENVIPQYRTLHVAGREPLSPELLTFETGVRDGAALQNRRYPARTIRVTYQLKADTAEDFRAAYNKLGAILNCENAELIFADEPDYYFTGTPSLVGEVEPGRNAVVGEIEFLCVDPFKYSVIEYEAEPYLEDGSFLIDYTGTYKTYPTLEASFYDEQEATEDGSDKALTGAGDCGYVAFFTEKEKIIQLGDPAEVDGDENAYDASQTLTNWLFQSANHWGGSTTAKKFALNSGLVPYATVEQKGSVAMKVATYASTPVMASTSATLLTATSKANRPYIHYKITAKTSGRTATSVKVTFSITTSLDKAESFFGRGYGLQGSIYVGGAWRNITLKKTTEYWKGKSGHTKSYSYTITGLSATDTGYDGIRFKVTRLDSLGTAGVLADTKCKQLPISIFLTPQPETYYLAASDYATGSKWHGPSITRTLPADASGETGASSFTCRWAHTLSLSDKSNATSELGGFYVMLKGTLEDGSTGIIAGVYVSKGKTGKTATVRLFTGEQGGPEQSFDLDVTKNNTYFKPFKTQIISKYGEKITFTIGGKARTIYCPNLVNAKVTAVTVGFMQWGTRTPLDRNGLHLLKFTKHYCETYKDEPNKFGANDVVTADCRTGEILLNGTAEPQLGALGDDWEEFVLQPGLNQIGVGYSEWVPDEYAPNFKVRYREVFL